MACEGLARIYASCPDPEFHDGEMAVKCANLALQKDLTDPEIILLLAKAKLRNLEIDEGVRLIIKAANHAETVKKAEVLKELADICKKGTPIPKTASLEWLKKGADLNLPWAMETLAQKHIAFEADKFNQKLIIEVSDRAISMGLMILTLASLYFYTIKAKKTSTDAINLSLTFFSSASLHSVAVLPWHSGRSGEL